MGVIAFDTETHLLYPGCLAPPLVCMQWQRSGSGPMIRHRADVYQIIREFLEGPHTLVGHNVAYDMAVIAAQWPDLLPLIVAKYDRDEVTDTMIRDQLVMIARGTFRSQMGADGEMHGVKYSLADCYKRHTGEHLRKEGFRLFYRAFDEIADTASWTKWAAEFQERVRAGDVPWVTDALATGLIKTTDIDGLLAADPSEALSYALEDGRTTLAIYESQERHFAPLLKDQFRQARAAFALHLSSAWGVYTDEGAVDALEVALRAEFEALTFELQQVGIIRPDGTADTKVAKAFMVAACEEEGLPVARTKGGDVSLGAESCDRFDDTTVIGRYSRFLTVRKTLSNDIKMLRAGAGDNPLQPRYDLADTGRMRASKPNTSAINRGAGIREAIVPREGTFFIQADFEGLELHTLAAWCLKKIGWSKLADDLNARRDVHLGMAAELLGITYEEALRRKKAGDKEIKEYRQRAKPVNFGNPGGMGKKKFVALARNSYGVEITEEQGAAYKQAWLRRQPEMVDFFASAGALTNNPDHEGTESTLFTERGGSKLRYSMLCNRRFQALGADCAKAALWAVTKACYVEPASPLYGCRPVLFIHDEVIAEAPEARASAAAKELGRLMCEAANAVYLAKVPVRTEPLVMRCWSKSAEPLYAVGIPGVPDGDLLPWSPEYAAVMTGVGAMAKWAGVGAAGAAGAVVR